MNGETEQDTPAAKADPATLRIILVDTNCFVRLYFSDLRPLLGRVMVGHRLMSSRELAEETRQRSGLTLRHPWLTLRHVQDDLSAAIVELTPEEDEQYNEDARYYRREADEYLRRLCHSRGLAIARQLSHADAKALAMALDRGYALATDEWPLREFSQYVEADDNGDRLPLFTSLEVLRLCVDAGLLNTVGVRSTVRQWLLCDERLPRSWRTDYRRLFHQDAPDAQG